MLLRANEAACSRRFKEGSLYDVAEIYGFKDRVIECKHRNITPIDAWSSCCFSMSKKQRQDLPIIRTRWNFFFDDFIGDVFFTEKDYKKKINSLEIELYDEMLIDVTNGRGWITKITDSGDLNYDCNKNDRVFILRLSPDCFDNKKEVEKNYLCRIEIATEARVPDRKYIFLGL